MENDLIPQENWWQKNWKWFVPGAALLLSGILYMNIIVGIINKPPAPQHAFDKNKWMVKSGEGYLYRNQMVDVLLYTDKLRKLKKKQIIEMLGEPDRSDKEYLFYKVFQQRLNFFPLRTKTLVIKLSEDDSPNKVMLHQ